MYIVYVLIQKGSIDFTKQLVPTRVHRCSSIEEAFENLKGIVDIYPAMNPLGIDSITRGIPAFDLDMNRLFPGNIDGNMTEYLAAEIIKDVSKKLYK